LVQKFFVLVLPIVSMGEASSCGFESLGLMGLIIGGMIVSIGYSFFKNDKSKMEKPIKISGQSDEKFT